MLKTITNIPAQKKLTQGILLLVSLCLLQNSFASGQPCDGEGLLITSIGYKGLNKTRPRVVNRQISLVVGDRLNCAALSQARQAIEDLGLFKQVSVSSAVVSAESAVGLADVGLVHASGVKIIFSVTEKRYLILLPHLGSSESGSFSYGIRGRWSNIGGLNQRAKLKIRNKDFNSDLKDSEKKAIISFLSPQIRDSDFDAEVELGYIDLSTIAFGAPVTAEPFNEVYRYSSLNLSRWFHQGQRQHGWELGSTLKWRAWESDDPDLIASPDVSQSHLGLGLSAHYNKIHDRTYSFDGRSFTFRAEPSIQLSGERSPITQEVYGVWHKPYGSREHTEFEVRGGAGWSDGAYEDFVPFENSASARLRGISYDDFEGDRYYYLKAAYLTPYTFKPFDRMRLLAHPSLRAEFFVQAGDIYFQQGQRDLQGLAWSAGTGVRWRIPWFVGLQVGAGVAYHSEEQSVGFYLSGR